MFNTLIHLYTPRDKYLAGPEFGQSYYVLDARLELLLRLDCLVLLLREDVDIFEGNDDFAEKVQRLTVV
jgi:hypothetical protein